LQEIVEQLAIHSPVAAARFVHQFDAVVELLQTFPESGAPRPDLGPGRRAIARRPWLFVYRRRGEPVEIVRILDGRRDIAGLLGQ
jgi:plasmid stabilization system protein ParE